MSRYKNLLHWETKENLEQTNYYTGDKNYEMLPDNTLIQCQLVHSDGNKIKLNGEFGDELVWCRICDQRCFYKNILYSVKTIDKDEVYSTRASLVNWPRPNWAPYNYLANCVSDNTIDYPH